MTGRDHSASRQAARLHPRAAGESAVRWRKSSYSNHESNCVEVAEFDDGTVGFRDSKDRSGPALTFGRAAARAFVAAVADGEFAVE